jgi:hypothetical protein
MKISKVLSKYTVVAIIWFFALINLPAVGFACDCWPVSNANDAIKSSTQIFEAEVIQMKRFPIEKLGKDYKEFAVKMRIIKVWKGPIDDYIIVRTPAEKENCGFKFEIQKSYIVYALGGPIPLVTRCSRTAESDSVNAVNDRKYLGEGEIP